MADDLLARIHAEIDARLLELRPSVVEYEQLRSAAEAIGGATATTGKRGPGRPPRASTALETASVKPVLSRSSEDTTSADNTASADDQDVAADALVQESGAEEQPPSERPKRAGRAQQSENQQAIVAALEHGSHTVGELVVVTALSRPAIREGLRRLSRTGAVTRTKREGKAAYALPASRV